MGMNIGPSPLSTDVVVRTKQPAENGNPVAISYRSLDSNSSPISTHVWTAKQKDASLVITRGIFGFITASCFMSIFPAALSNDGRAVLIFLIMSVIPGWIFLRLVTGHWLWWIGAFRKSREIAFEDNK